MKRTRVLIIDDDEDDFLLTADHLKNIPGRAFDIEWASTYEQGLARIKSCEHDVYIVDYALGAKDGIALIREALEASCEEPMILLTGMDDPRVDEAAAQLGAFDYLLKGSLNADQLERSIRYSLAQAATHKALRENERKFRTAFDKSRDLNIIADLDGQLLSVSSAAEQLTGYSVPELLKMRAADLYVNPEDGQHLEKKLSLEGEAVGPRIELRCKNGDTRTCAIYATLQTDRNGKPYYQAVVHDLTAKIREERATLLSQKMEATGRLMRMLAHEVRNPLTNIGLALDGLSSELPPDSDLLDLADIIKRNADRISSLITQLLHSSRPTELNLQPITLREVIFDTLEDVKDRIALKKINATLDLADGHTAMLDREKIKIAFTNIIVNAIEAMDEGTGRLEISLRRAGQKLVASIRDNGSGISPENLNRLFEPYFTSKKHGIGLGLAATLNIIQSHGATVEVASKIGEGTSFYVTFDATEPIS